MEVNAAQRLHAGQNAREPGGESGPNRSSRRKRWSIVAIALNGQRSIEWTSPKGTPSGFEPREVVFGKSDMAGIDPIEIAIAGWTPAGRPTREALVKLHGLRLDKRATSVVLVVELANGEVLVLGPNSATAPVGPLPGEQAARMLQAVLDEPTVIAARTRLAGVSQAIDSTSIPGVKNSGLFANHELRVGVPQRADWAEACAASSGLLSNRGHELIKSLGYTAQQAGAHGLVLSGEGPHPQAIAVLIDEKETFETESPRFTVSPVAYGLKLAETNGVPWLIVLRGTQIRLYPARVELGVGRKGLAETFCEIDLPQLTLDNAGYLSLIFSTDALVEGGTAHQIMQESQQYAVELGARLRDKVYDDVVPELAIAVADQLIGLGYEMTAEELDLAYQLTLRIFFRLLFQVYAEDRRLLPFGENQKYDRNALKTVALDLVNDPDQAFDENSTSLWDDLAQVWRVIDSGDKAWGVPAYNGGLFTSDPEYNEQGAIIKKIAIDNSVMGPILKAMLLDVDEDGLVGPIDFRSLSVREFGTIYEGLLESSLGLAEVNLTLDDKDTWVPAKKGDKVWAEAGQVYFHNTSGQRKGTGSYFTPSFVVEHLLERSLDPALDEHLAKVAALLEQGDEAGANDLFFDFRVADLAMGSGHFLTAAIDHIEMKMAAFLGEEGHAVPGVAKELALLAHAAKDAIGAEAPEPEPSSLLRRQIARRCIYGLDINPIAVELARVSIWIHTFVRGLPMSSLDHNLVCANSLTGIGSIEEALDVLVPGRNGQATLFDEPIEKALESARTTLVDAALMPELSKDETRAATKMVVKARKEAETAKLLFDAAVLTRIGHENMISGVNPEPIAKSASHAEAQALLAPLNPAHMPVLFPEVFLRENGGFDVLVGNPPWKQLMVDELRFWLRVEPGILSLAPAHLKAKVADLKLQRCDLLPALEDEIKEFDRLRLAVTSGPFPGVGGGGRAPDLYLAFGWRNWQLLRAKGYLGVLFPRTLLSASTSAAWRVEVLRSSSSTPVTVTNAAHWVFQSVHASYSITLLNLKKFPEKADLRLSGPFYDRTSFEANRNDYSVVELEGLLARDTQATIPQLPDKESTRIWNQLQRFSGFAESGIGFRPVYEFNATTDRPTFDSGGPTPRKWPVYGGSTFNIWDPDAGEPYAWADPETVMEALQEKRHRQIKLKSSAFYGMASEWAADRTTLPCMSARIAFRDVTNATNTRTCIAALVPPEVVLVNQAPYLLRILGDELDEAFLLGVLASTPLDWYARRYVELHLNFHIFNGLPIPDPTGRESLRDQVVNISGRLAASDVRFSEWAAAVGVPVGSVSEEEKPLLEAELDALVAHLYGLSREHVIHIFETFHRGWDYQPRLTLVLGYFDEIEASK
jgi:hypothetical protein